ncbi:beta-galactosidase [candidate division KSB1 bacterium]|nr:beta-galactosidase [candidate division KSB1 bacterium]
MRRLLKDEYIPFGTQYYRAPSPHRQDWERDLENIGKLGMNMLKFWVQWRWNHPEEDKFYFDDIDKLMDIAYANKLKVMLNTIFDVAPAWIYRKYPDASMLTLDGRRIGPQTQPHRQIGGLGYCFNHDGVMEHFFKFLQVTIQRYKDHPALAIWNVGSEPELTSSMAEMRQYADNAEKMGDMLCFCPNCQKKFRLWLQEKYTDIERLNEAWNRNYQSFDDAEIPITRNTFNDMIDWRMFFVYTLGENVKRRFRVAQTEDKGKHPLMCHHVFIQGFPLVSTANDPWNVGQYGDLHGFTQMDDAMMTDILRSCAKDKPVISAEMLMLPGYTLDLPPVIDENDIKRFIFTGIAGNQKGFIFWQYRPEILGREAPTWGLSFPDGSETPWLKSWATVGRVVQKHAAFLLDAKPVKAEVALIYNPENQIFAWMSTQNEKSATDSLLGTHKALYQHNYNIDFIHPKEFDLNILSNYKVVYIPFPYCLNEKMCRALEAWVKAGGVLIGESYFAGWNMERGFHEKIVPGYGLHRVFKTRQGVVNPAGEDGVEIRLCKDMPYLHSGEIFTGALVQESLVCEGSEKIAEFADGSPAATYAQYGKGKAVLIGSYIGLVFQRQGATNNGEFIASLVRMASDIQHPQVDNNVKARVDVLQSDKHEIMIIVQNLTGRAVEVTVRIPFIQPKTCKEIFMDTDLTLSRYDDGVSTVIKMQAKEVKVFRG